MPVTLRAIDEFLRRESAAGILLFGAALLAMLAINTALAPLYDGLLSTPVSIRVGALEIAKPLLLWINDGLMAVFFFLIGLEVKREVIEGELSSRDKAVLPLIAAVGGMAVPALVFVAINASSPAHLKGWAIPAATDIAFALGVIALLGRRVPAALKILLLAIAIFDDIGAIVIIALFYTADVSTFALALAALGIVTLVALNRLGVVRPAAYVLVGIFLWVCVLKSGVHATLAGVVTALAVPLSARKPGTASPLKALEHVLHPWVAFGVLPLFAFANAGVSLDGIGVDALTDPLPLGIVGGLVVGKQLGVFGAILAAVRFNLAALPAGVSWPQIYGLACLTGVGFTMSLFIGSLAFEDMAQMNPIRIGVLAGSLVSGVLGYMVLRSTGSAQKT